MTSGVDPDPEYVAQTNLIHPKFALQGVQSYWARAVASTNLFAVASADVNVISGSKYSLSELNIPRSHLTSPSFIEKRSEFNTFHSSFYSTLSFK